MSINLLKPGKFILFFTIANFLFQNTIAQNNAWKDSIVSYQENYINTHEVVTGNDRKYIHFYHIDKSYRLVASFKRIADTKGFEMNTS